MEAAPAPEILRVGPIEIRPAEYRALAGDQMLALTPHELELLTALARRAGRIVDRKELYEVVWSRELRPDDRSVDVYVRRLRAKLAKELPGWTVIHTHVGFGYRLSPENSHVFHTPATPE
ncbi:MAG TPA: response regulator transcription factor [Thermoleophilaceae bacterium]|nr:response regulator transcription factor [Thermoleophilaceae bacterium]